MHVIDDVRIVGSPAAVAAFVLRLGQPAENPESLPEQKQEKVVPLRRPS